MGISGKSILEVKKNSYGQIIVTNQILKNWVEIEKDIYKDGLTGLYYQKKDIQTNELTTEEIYYDVIELYERILKPKKDSLTGLFDKEAITRFMNNLNTQPDTYIIAMCDVDDFKRINDTYGHVVGDFVLKIVGETFLKNIRKEDYPGRYGGDEFIFIFRSTNLVEITLKIEKIIKDITDSIKGEVEKKFPTIEMQTPITLSAGIAMFIPGMNSEDTISLADRALYHVKKEGKNNVAYFDHDNNKGTIILANSLPKEKEFIYKKGTVS